MPSRVPLNSLSNGTILQPGTFLPAVGATAMVYTYDPNSTLHGGANSPSIATVFQSDAGATQLTQPISTDSNGQLVGYVAGAQDLDIVATFQGRAAVAARAEPEVASTTPVLTGSPTDDTSAIGAGTGRKLPVPSVGVPQYNAATYGFDVQGNDVNATPWANLIAAIAAQAHPRGAYIVFPAGDICLNNCVLDTTTLPLNSRVIVGGQGDATRIFPGGSQGRALTIKGSLTVTMEMTVRDLKLGYASELPVVDLDYRQPILELQGPNAPITMSGVTGYLGGTGTLLHLNDVYNGALDVRFTTGAKGQGIVWDMAADTADQADTLALRSSALHGEFGLIVNGPINTLELDEVKFVRSGSSTLAESFLASAAAAGASTIVLNAGGGALFAVGDVIGIDCADYRAAATFGFEPNVITAISTDTLTLQWPLKYAHDSATHHVQVVRGGVAMVVGQVNAHHYHNSHFEGHDTAILANSGFGLKLENNSQQCNRLLRVTGAGGAGNTLSDIDIGQTLAVGAPTGAPTSNIILDVPSWATSTPSRVAIDGPLLEAGAAAPTVNWLGTSYTLDTRGYVTGAGIGLGTGFAAGPWLTPGVKLGRDGIRMRGLLTMAGAVAAGSTVLTLPPWMVPFRSLFALVYQINSQSTSATPAPNALWVQGSDQGASKGVVSMRVASTAAGWLDLDSVPSLTVHQN